MNDIADDGCGSADPGPLWPWAAGLGDRARAAAALALAAGTLRRRLGGQVTTDRVAGRLVVTDPGPRGAATPIVISLERLAVVLEREPLPRWPGLVAGFVEAALETNRLIAESRFGRWEVARSRLLVRAVRRRHGGGPLSRPYGSVLSLAVGITGQPMEGCGRAEADDSAVIVVSSALFERWGRPAEQVYRVARANTRRRIRPELTIAPELAARYEPGRPNRAGAPGSGPLSAVMLCGGPWTTGVLVDPPHFLARAGQPSLADHESLWISALDPAAVLIVAGARHHRQAVIDLVDDWFHHHRDGFPRNLRPVDRRR